MNQPLISHLLSLALVLRNNITLLFDNFLLFRCWELRWKTEGFDFTLQFVGTCLDWHARAVETEWEENLLATQTLISHTELITMTIAHITMISKSHVDARETQNSSHLPPPWTL